MSELRPLGFVLPDRWGSHAEMRFHASRMRSVNSLSGALSPTKLGIPTVLDQGDVGSCGGQAIVQGIYIDEQANGITSEIRSPAFPYWCARREAVASDEDVTDSGIDPFDMVDAIADFGACSYRTMPYDTREPNRKPGALAFQTAQRVRAKMAPIFVAGDDLFDVCKHVLTFERKALFLGIEVRPAFDNVGSDGIIDDPSGESRGLHAIAGFGWDEPGVDIANSWGHGWGRGGLGILSPRYLAECCVFAASVELVQ